MTERRGKGKKEHQGKITQTHNERDTVSSSLGPPRPAIHYVAFSLSRAQGGSARKLPTKRTSVDREQGRELQALRGSYRKERLHLPTMDLAQHSADV